jgi:hypothetical protein
MFFQSPDFLRNDWVHEHDQVGFDRQSQNPVAFAAGIVKARNQSARMSALSLAVWFS